MKTSAYQIKWNCFLIEGKKGKKLPKFITKNTFSTCIIGNVVLTHSKNDAAKIVENIEGTKYEKCKKFQITDKQFGLIQLTNVNYSMQNEVSEVIKLKKCSMPHLEVNNDGKIALIPVTNMQFMGTDALERKTIWIS
jgi:hypothetical protein